MHAAGCCGLSGGGSTALIQGLITGLMARSVLAHSRTRSHSHSDSYPAPTGA